MSSYHSCANMQGTKPFHPECGSCSVSAMNRAPCEHCVIPSPRGISSFVPQTLRRGLSFVKASHATTSAPRRSPARPPPPPKLAFLAQLAFFAEDDDSRMQLLSTSTHPLPAHGERAGVRALVGMRAGSQVPTPRNFHPATSSPPRNPHLMPRRIPGDEPEQSCPFLLHGHPIFT